MKVVLILSLMTLIILSACSTNQSPKEQACISSGGTVETALCCAGADDFPSLCEIGACGCAPLNSQDTKICSCGEGKCFDGTKCKIMPLNEECANDPNCVP